MAGTGDGSGGVGDKRAKIVGYLVVCGIGVGATLQTSEFFRFVQFWSAFCFRRFVRFRMPPNPEEISTRLLHSLSGMLLVIGIRLSLDYGILLRSSSVCGVC